MYIIVAYEKRFILLRRNFLFLTARCIAKHGITGLLPKLKAINKRTSHVQYMFRPGTTVEKKKKNENNHTNFTADDTIS